jgi:VWFA-related protein
MSQKRVLEAERIASFRFLDQVLRETKDKIFLMSFDSSAIVDQPLTNSRRQLDESLSYIDTPTRKELALQGGGSTVLYDAVAKAASEILAPQPNRKAVIILSDGVDTGSNLTLTQAADAALRADTLIYSILFTDSRAYPSFIGADGRGALSRLSRDTGGAFFEVTRKQSLEQIYNLIQEELRSQYSLAFVSDQPVRLPEFRKLRLTLPNHKNLTVQTRDRYWAKR